MSKGSKRRPTINTRMAEANLEILHGGWAEVSYDDLHGTVYAECKRFRNNHDPEVVKLYWRPGPKSDDTHNTKSDYLTDEDCMELANKMGANK